MKPTRAVRVLSVAALLAATVLGVQAHVARETQKADYLSWPSNQVQRIGKAMRVDGRVGGRFDFRVVHTEHSYNYKLRATWLTPEVIKASARLAQLQNGLSDTETEGLVKEAEAAGDVVVLIEIDPREGSGVIPLDWVAFLGPQGDDTSPRRNRGRIVPQLRELRGLSGVFRRDYNYEPFWATFSLTGNDGHPLFPTTAAAAELVVRIHNKEGRVRWPVPSSARRMNQ